MFFAHLAIEKALKAHVVKETREVPPKIHNLVRLAEIAKLQLDQPKLDFLRQFNMYQLEGRYPDTVQAQLEKKTIIDDLLEAEEFLTWLIRQL